MRGTSVLGVVRNCVSTESWLLVARQITPSGVWRYSVAVTVWHMKRFPPELLFLPRRSTLPPIHSWCILIREEVVLVGSMCWSTRLCQTSKSPHIICIDLCSRNCNCPPTLAPPFLINSWFLSRCAGAFAGFADVGGRGRQAGSGFHLHSSVPDGLPDKAFEPSRRF